jgi:nucleotide-binding universal stress UspA family protein
VASGQIVIGYDGSDASELALQRSSSLLRAERALVVVVWEPGVAFEMPDAYTPVPGLLAPVDVRAALDLDQKMYENAQRLAQRGVDYLRAAGLDADGLAVADELTVAETLVRLATDREADALVVGAHSKGRMEEILLGSTSRAVLRHAPCPVLVVREPEHQRDHD